MDQVRGEVMDQVNLLKQHQWEAGPDEELKIPETFITRLRHEIVVLGQKKEFTFRCAKYKVAKGGAWRFSHVIIDTSKLDAKGDLELKRVTYHPEIVLVNATFMVVPAPEEVD